MNVDGGFKSIVAGALGPLVNITGDSHDGTEADLSAQRVAVRPQAAAHGLVDDHHVRRFRGSLGLHFLYSKSRASEGTHRIVSPNFSQPLTRTAPIRATTVRQ
jgi:hypothetical protein